MTSLTTLGTVRFRASEVGDAENDHQAPINCFCPYMNLCASYTTFGTETKDSLYFSHLGSLFGQSLVFPCCGDDRCQVSSCY